MEAEVLGSVFSILGSKCDEETIEFECKCE